MKERSGGVREGVEGEMEDEATLLNHARAKIVSLIFAARRKPHGETAANADVLKIGERDEEKAMEKEREKEKKSE